MYTVSPQCYAQRKLRSCLQLHKIKINCKLWLNCSRKILENYCIFTAKTIKISTISHIVYNQYVVWDWDATIVSVRCGILDVLTDLSGSEMRGQGWNMPLECLCVSPSQQQGDFFFYFFFLQKVHAISIRWVRACSTSCRASLTHSNIVVPNLFFLFCLWEKKDQALSSKQSLLLTPHHRVSFAYKCVTSQTKERLGIFCSSLKRLNYPVFHKRNQRHLKIKHNL